MSDFLLDFRPSERRALARAAERMRFVEGSTCAVFDEPCFGLAVTHNGDPALWSPYRAEDGSLVAIAGSPVFDESEWDLADAVSGAGGLAAKAVYRQFQKLGAAALERLNGNCAVVVYDHPGRRVHLVTDCCGVFPAFRTDSSDAPLYSSHPDVLAATAEVANSLDETSLAEFILSRTVTPPFSYYRRVRALDQGCVYTFQMDRGGSPRVVRKRYYELTYRGQPDASESDLANQLAAALRRSVERRTNPRLGRYAIALSGGLDSRVILATSVGRERSLAFTCYDEPNQELKTAEAIAQALSAPFRAVRRSPEYYAEHAELGVRISGGMGSLANNHFLGVMPFLKSEGIENLLTGCYCDYLFKALPLNRRCHWLTRREALAPFRREFYFHQFSASSPLAESARERWESRVPPELRNRNDAAAVFQIESGRTFPLYYEGDNQQRVVPQRLIGWRPAFVDRDLMEVYCRLPYHFKLNRSVFRKVVLSLAPELRAIPDANTGATLDESPVSEWLKTSKMLVERRWRRFRASAASEESWPNWSHYVPCSRKLNDLWNRPNRDAMELFRRVLGPAGFPDDVEELKSSRPFLFVGLLTLKLWLDQRA